MTLKLTNVLKCAGCYRSWMLSLLYHPLVLESALKNQYKCWHFGCFHGARGGGEDGLLDMQTSRTYKLLIKSVFSFHFQKMKWPGWASSALLQMLIRQSPPPPVSTHSSSVPLNATLTLQSRFRLQSFPDILSQLSQASQSNLSPSQFVQFSVLLTMSGLFQHLFIWLGSKVSQLLQVDSPSQCCCLSFWCPGFCGSVWFYVCRPLIAVVCRLWNLWQR